MMGGRDRGREMNKSGDTHDDTRPMPTSICSWGGLGGRRMGTGERDGQGTTRGEMNAAMSNCCSWWVFLIYFYY
ncbi:hypothetical protein L208DRAFT_1400588 [Tricholoma matsutake]|nr:hypothetical protein L208DRAFT_1400588 [Tricholoma matsutake 945]